MPVIPPGTSAYSVARASLRVEVGLQHLDPRRALADLEHDYAVGHRRLEFFNAAPKHPHLYSNILKREAFCLALALEYPAERYVFVALTPLATN